MKILLISGHGAGDVGACGCGYQEYALTRELVNNIAPRLRKYATVDVYNQNRNAFDDCQDGTFKIGAYDYVLEVHFNACVNDQYGNNQTTGTEIYVTSSENAVTVEQSIVDKVSACGLRNRGVKVADFLVIRTVKNKGISSALIETCFIDDRDDMNVYVAKKNEIAQAITNGIVEGFGLGEVEKPAVTPAPQHKPQETSIDELAREVLAGKWGNGEIRKQALINAGYDYNAIQNRVNALCGVTSNNVATPSMTARQFALEVWNQGKYGTGATRKANAERLGVNFNEAQRLINILASGGSI